MTAFTAEDGLGQLASFLLGQAFEATVVVVLVFLASRFIRHSAVVHALWLVALIKLLTPSLVEVPAPGVVTGFATQARGWVSASLEPAAPPPLSARIRVPRTEPAAMSDSAIAPALSPSLSSASAGQVSASSRRRSGLGFSAMGAAGLLFFVGTAGILLLGAARVFRSHRQLRAGTAPPEQVAERLLDLAQQLDLARVPRLRVVDARVSPMLRLGRYGAELLLPAALLERLDAAELDAVLAHELAHFKRRDHWVRLVEALALAFFWWYPLLGLMRRGLHRAEERACDAWVQRLLPGSGRAYARALLGTLEFLRPQSAPAPALACTIEPKNDWKERLTMIVTERTPKPLRAWQRWLLALCALLLLSVFPTLATPDGEAASEEQMERVERELEDQQRELERQRHDLERQRLALEEQMEALRQRAIAVETERERAHSQMQIAATEAAAARLEAQGERAEAERMRREVEQIRQHSALAQRHLEIERERAAQRHAAEIELQRAHLELADLARAGNERAVRELEEEIEARQRVLEEQVRHEMAGRIELERAQLEQETAHLEAEIEQLIEQGLEAEVERAREELEQVREAAEVMAAREAELAEEEVSRTDRRRVEAELEERLEVLRANRDAAAASERDSLEVEIRRLEEELRLLRRR